MGQDADSTLSEIAETRAALERDVDALFSRLPEPDVLAAKAKTYGLAAGGAAATAGVVALRMKKRGALKARRMDARINAEELARAFSPHAPDGSPAADDTAADDGGGGRTGLVLLLVTIVAVALTAVARQRSGD